MANVLDVAKYFILLSSRKDEPPITHLKLQKLVYYAHAWYIGLNGPNNPLVEDDSIEAWVHGPVFPRLYHEYRRHGYSEILYDSNLPGNLDGLDDEEIEIIEAVWEVYGEYNGKYLEDLTHNEDPWNNARGDHNPLDYGNNIIDNNMLFDFYNNLLENRALR